MNIAKYIGSGILESYVAGQLSAEENLRVAELANTHLEIKTEIDAIEDAIVMLAAKSSMITAKPYDLLASKMSTTARNTIRSSNIAPNPWFSYIGWAASILLLVGLFSLFITYQDTAELLEKTTKDKISLEQNINATQDSLKTTQNFLEIIRDKNSMAIVLGGQEIAPNSYAKVYWNKIEKKVFVDAVGLPTPPIGFVYQVWSLKLSPTLTPTSLGILPITSNNTTMPIALSNTSKSEAFGITLEPAGGSSTPTLEQLYVLGTVASS